MTDLEDLINSNDEKIESKAKITWKIDYGRYVSNIISCGMRYLLFPFFFWTILKNNLMWNIHDETFYAVWITLFFINFFNRLVNPPKYRVIMKVKK